MRQWTVEGADRKTGDDRVVAIEAIDEAEARAQAKQMGLVVSDVREANSYAASGRLSPSVVGTASDATTSRRSPGYAEITHGDRMLRLFAAVVAAFGWVALAVAALAIIVGFIAQIVQTRSSDDGGTAPLLSGVVVAIGAIVYALPCFVVAIILKMYGALALAIRDIAQNSFR